MSILYDTVDVTHVSSEMKKVVKKLKALAWIELRHECSPLFRGLQSKRGDREKW
ncbi:MAG: hypothetical protein ACK401_00620 [Archaeoglobaceae archaeon]